MATEALFIDRSGLSAVKIHPVVVLSILEQYVRRDCDDGKADGHVIGEETRFHHSRPAASLMFPWFVVTVLRRHVVRYRHCGCR